MDRVRCAHCGEVIGTYEPMRLLLPGGVVLQGSLLGLADQLVATGAVVVHEDCYDAFIRQAGGGSIEPPSE